MELNTSFIDIQGILLKLKQDIGDFTRINYKGGKFNFDFLLILSY